MTGRLAAFASASVAAGVPERLMKRFEKSMPPTSSPIGGIITVVDERGDDF